MDAARSPAERRDWGPPAALGAHPADLAANAWERDKVVELRRRKVGWQNIGNMLRRPAETLRGLYEPLTDGVMRPAIVVAAQTRRPAHASVSATRQVGALRALAAIEATPGATSADLAFALGLADLAAQRMLRDLKDRGWIRNLSRREAAPASWITTQAGRAALAREEDA